jgi:hypothetical protein
VGFTGAHCEQCEAGYHRDARALCVPDRSCAEQDVDPCGAHGQCDDRSGTVACMCDSGYEGARCQLCIEGYQRNATGQCLQAFLTVDGGLLPATPASECNVEYCHLHGQCIETKGKHRCTCNFGYAGERCDLCANGFGLRNGRCVEDVECSAGSCGGCVNFDAAGDFPEYPDNCVLSGSFALSDLDVSSADGSGDVWLCAGSFVYDFTSPHVAVEAGAKLPARLDFHAAISELSFEYVARSPGFDRTVKLELKADDKVVATLETQRMRLNKGSWTFAPPVKSVSLRNLGPTTELVAIDRMVYKLSKCD